MDFKLAIEEQNNINHNKIINNNINCKYNQNKEFSFSNEDENDNPNRIRLTIDKKMNISEYNNIIVEKDKSKKGFKINNNLLNNEINTINQIKISGLVEENNLLKKEIEIVKSNLIILEEKELLHKKTIQRIYKINKEKDKSYKNSISLINEYKKREDNFQIKIKEMEIEFNKKEEELNNELSIFKKELFKKNILINELNQKINELNKQIRNLKKIVSEKIRIIHFITKNKSDSRKDSDKNIKDTKNLKTSKSCNNLNFKKFEHKSNIKLKRKDNSLNNLRNFILNKNINNKLKSFNSFNLYEKIKINEYTNKKNNESNLGNLNISNDDNLILTHKRKNFSYKKLIPNNNIPNCLKTQTLKKNNSYRDINYNTENNSLRKKQNSYIDSTNSINNIYNNNKVQLIKILNKNTIKEFEINKDKNEIKNMVMLTPIPNKLNQKSKKNKIFEYNNYSLNLNNNEKNIQTLYKDKKNNIKNVYIIKKDNNNNNCYDEFKNNTIVDSVSNTKIKKDYKKNKIIEINKYYLHNHSLISNSSLRNISSEKNN